MIPASPRSLRVQVPFIRPLVRPSPPSGQLTVFHILQGAIRRYNAESAYPVGRMDICPGCGSLHVPYCYNPEAAEPDYPFAPWHEQCWERSYQGQTAVVASELQRGQQPETLSDVFAE